MAAFVDFALPVRLAQRLGYARPVTSKVAHRLFQKKIRIEHQQRTGPTDIVNQAENLSGLGQPPRVQAAESSQRPVYGRAIDFEVRTDGAANELRPIRGGHTPARVLPVENQQRKTV